MPRGTAIVSAIEDATARLDALQVREEELRRCVADSDRDEPALRRAVTAADRALERETLRGLYEPSIDATERLRIEQGELAALLARRDAAQKELAELPAQRLAVLREVAAAVWDEFSRAKQAALSAGLDVANKVEPYVRRYTEAAERAEKAKADTERIFRNAGAGSARVIDDLRRRSPEPQAEDTPDTRQGLRRAEALRRLFAQDLRWPS